MFHANREIAYCCDFFYSFQSPMVTAAMSLTAGTQSLYYRKKAVAEKEPPHGGFFDARDGNPPCCGETGVKDVELIQIL